jgi:hypothetical protein
MEFLDFPMLELTKLATDLAMDPQTIKYPKFLLKMYYKIKFEIFNISIVTGNNSGGSSIIDLTPFEIYIAPSQILTISASSTQSASVGVSVNWTEDT